jgi:glycosyltransferase involved in cell wall biosynthesis
MRRIVCHLLDQQINLNSRYYRAIGLQHDRDRYPVTFCFIDTLPSLPDASSALQAPVFSLGVDHRVGYTLAIPRLVRLVRREKAAVLHAHFFYPTLVGLIAARIARVRFVFTRHHSDHNIRIGKRWHTRVDALCARGADHVIAVSEETRRIMTDVEGVPATQISVVYNGMDPLPEPSPERVAAIRAELGLGAEPVCLMIGRLHEEKGHRFLFDAVPSIISRVGPIRVLLAGLGAHRAALEADVQRRGLQDTVRFLGWRPEIPELISLASVVVLPSLAESFGFALLEAGSLGKPVVAAATGGVPEVVVQGENGLLVPPRDPVALAESISRVLLDPALAKALGEGGRRQARRFSFERMIRGYEAVYAHL